MSNLTRANKAIMVLKRAIGLVLFAFVSVASAETLAWNGVWVGLALLLALIGVKMLLKDVLHAVPSIIYYTLGCVARSKPVSVHQAGSILYTYDCRRRW
jgi:hypothetical protein